METQGIHLWISICRALRPHHLLQGGRPLYHRSTTWSLLTNDVGAFADRRLRGLVGHKGRGGGTMCRKHGQDGHGPTSHRAQSPTSAAWLSHFLGAALHLQDASFDDFAQLLSTNFCSCHHFQRASFHRVNRNMSMWDSADCACSESGSTSQNHASSAARLLWYALCPAWS